MEDIQIWSIDGSQAERLSPSSRTESEQMLEEILVENPSLLMDDLILVGRQTPTEGGPLDLLGVDGDGRLVVFELKRGTLSRDAVAQIIDYASDLDSMDLAGLAEHISENSGAHGIGEIEDFNEWYSQDFGELESLKPLRLFLVGLGADDRTTRMVKFLAENSSMDISLLTFHGFEYDGKTLLAKQVEVAAPEEPGPRTRSGYVSREERMRAFNARARDLGVTDVVEAVRQMFVQTSIEVYQGRFSAVHESPGVYSIAFQILEETASGKYSYRAYFNISMEGQPGKVRIDFYPRAIQLCLERFNELVQQDPFEKRAPSWARTTEQVQWDIVLPLNSMEEWKAHEEKVTTVTRAVYTAWESDSGE